MKCARILDAYKFDYPERDIPEITDDQVLLKNNYLGVCASDIQIYHGKHKYVKYPLVMGHEVSSVIAKVGKNVTDYKVGDRVVVQPQVVCGHCYPCETGRFNVCENLKVIGVHMDGCACEYIAVDPWNLHRTPDALPDDVAALVEPVAVGVGSVKRSRDYQDANIVVLGAGTIGNLTAQCAKALGARKVMITDILDSKLAIAEKCGIDYCVNTGKTDLSAAIVDAFGAKRKADIIIDCAATRGTFASALAAARKNSTIVISGNFKDPVEFDVPSIQRSEISLVGHMMYVKEDFRDALRFLLDGSINSDLIITQHFPLDEYDKAFAFIDEHPADCMKVLIDIGK
jgi:L-iditol 2-dehydrogenase